MGPELLRGFRRDGDDVDPGVRSVCGQQALYGRPPQAWVPMASPFPVLLHEFVGVDQDRPGSPFAPGSPQAGLVASPTDGREVAAFENTNARTNFMLISMSLDKFLVTAEAEALVQAAR